MAIFPYYSLASWFLSCASAIALLVASLATDQWVLFHHTIEKLGLLHMYVFDFKDKVRSPLVAEKNLCISAVTIHGLSLLVGAWFFCCMRMRRGITQAWKLLSFLPITGATVTCLALLFLHNRMSQIEKASFTYGDSFYWAVASSVAGSSAAIFMYKGIAFFIIDDDFESDSETLERGDQKRALVPHPPKNGPPHHNHQHHQHPDHHQPSPRLPNKDGLHPTLTSHDLKEQPTHLGMEQEPPDDDGGGFLSDVSES